MQLPANRYRVSLFGYGITTKAIAAKFGPCTVYDDHVNKPFTDDAGNRLRPASEFDPRYSDLEIPSPGIPPKHPLIAAARHLKGEYDFFAEIMPFSVWISGTNGKTTTTQMLTHLLAERGAVAGGNIGTPLAELDPAAPLWVLETSSFTLHYTDTASPDLYALLPVTPDHLSWHGGMEGYIADKLKPLATMKEGEAALIPEALLPHLPETAAWVVGYKDADDLAKRFGIDTARLRFKGGFLLDAVIAMAVDAILFDRRDYDRINAFVIEPHRQEELHDALGRLWVNDTKATNIDAALAAMAAYGDRRVHLIVGGDDKGVDLEPLLEALKAYDVALYAIGSNASRLMEAAAKAQISCRECGVLEKAVEAIAERHDAEAVALLSPAAASLDQFRSYAERGNLFKEYVGRLGKA